MRSSTRNSPTRGSSGDAAADSLRGVTGALIKDGPESTDLYRRDAVLYSAEVVSVIFAGLGGNGWRSGCDLTADPTPDAYRHLAAGEVWVEGQLVTVPEQSVGPVVAHGTLDRWAYWSVDAAGNGQIDLGVPALPGQALPPRLPPGRAPLALEPVSAGISLCAGVPLIDLRVALRPLAVSSTITDSGGGTIAAAEGLTTATVTADIAVVFHASAGQGTQVRMVFVQDGTGGHAVSGWSSPDGPIVWLGGTPATLFGDPGGRTYVTALYDGVAWLAEGNAYL